MNENEQKNSITVDLTKVAENAYDDTLKKPLQNTSGIVSTVIDFFHNTVLYPMQQYNLYAKNKLEKYAEDLRKKVEDIPSENLVSPRVNILGPTIDGLKYNLDEEYIKDMFTNILTSEMDSRKQSKVLPSYIEIVKQLSKVDAEMLQFFSQNHLKDEPILKLKFKYKNGGFNYISDDIFLIFNNSYKVLNAIPINNLERLKIIEPTFMEYRHNNDLYNEIFQQISATSTIPLQAFPLFDKLDYAKGLLHITSFGQNFIDICLS